MSGTPTTEVEEENISATVTPTTEATPTSTMPSNHHQGYSSYSLNKKNSLNGHHHHDHEPVIRSPRFLTLASCSKDPCGIICMFITYSAVFYADYVVTKWIVMTTFVSLWGTFHVVVFNLIVGLLIMAHLRAVFTDPGFVTTKYHADDDYLRGVSSSSGGLDSPRSHSQDGGDINDQPTPSSVPSNYTLCPRCNLYRPPRAHHCRICKRCIRRMDHQFNQKYFIQFLFYVGLLSAYAIGLVLYTWVESSQSQHPSNNEPKRWNFNNYKMCVQYGPVEDTNINSVINDNLNSNHAVGSEPIHNESHIVKQTRILHSVILMLESLLFGMFVLAILIDEAILITDETIVEQHIHGKKQGPPGARSSSSTGSGRRGSSGVKKSKMDSLRDVCGTGHFLLWILPCHTRDEIVIEKRLNDVV